MNSLDRKFLPLDNPFHMHQARAIRTGDILGAGTHMILYLFVLMQVETSGSSMANIPPKPQHSSTRFGSNTSIPSPRKGDHATCNSTGYYARWATRDATHAPRGNYYGYSPYAGKRPTGIPVSPRRARTRRYHKSSLLFINVILPQYGDGSSRLGANCRGAYHVVIVLKLFLHPEGQASRLILEAGVRHGLSATGLVHRIIDIHTHYAQHLYEATPTIGGHRARAMG